MLLHTIYLLLLEAYWLPQENDNGMYNKGVNLLDWLLPLRVYP